MDSKNNFTKLSRICFFSIREVSFFNQLLGGAVQSSQDGLIVAVIGGRNYNFGNYNYATQKQQPGSSVKPFLDYGLAFENLDWSTGHSINDDDNYNGKLKNWDRQFHGLVTVENALENSWNIPAIKHLMKFNKKLVVIKSKKRWNLLVFQ